jgi:hypothetical protein
MEKSEQKSFNSQYEDAYQKSMLKDIENGLPQKNWRSWGSWFSWGSPVGLGLFILSLGGFIVLLHLAGTIH